MFNENVAGNEPFFVPPKVNLPERPVRDGDPGFIGAPEGL
tara:strand:+ start:83 stop:202 length:120 start_codon:yes stop_codon:yes gene_type:complete